MVPSMMSATPTVSESLRKPGLYKCRNCFDTGIIGRVKEGPMIPCHCSPSYFMGVSLNGYSECEGETDEQYVSANFTKPLIIAAFVGVWAWGGACAIGLLWIVEHLLRGAGHG